jgi:hypothetical protein
MNKEEQLKIYSAYLPYGLMIETRTDEEIKTEGSYISKLIGIDQYGLVDEFHNTWEYEVRPILYDLSYLTKEIEHEGEIIILAEKIFKREWQDIAEYYVRCNQIMKLSYDNIQLLLKHHFNVFNLPESEYINKATITNK